MDQAHKEDYKIYREALLTGLKDDNIIGIDSSDNKYHVLKIVIEEIGVTGGTTNSLNIPQEYWLFKELCISVYYNLKLPEYDQVRKLPFSKILLEFQGKGIFNIIPANSKEHIYFFDSASNMLNSTEYSDVILDQFEKYKYNFSNYRMQLLEYFSNVKMSSHLSEFTLDTVGYKDIKNIDLLYRSNLPVNNDILVEVKYRKKINSNLKELILNANEALEYYKETANKHNSVFLIVYTEDHFGEFKNLIYKFEQLVKELLGNKKVFLIPVYIKELHLIDESIKDAINKNDLYDKESVSDFFKGNWKCEWKLTNGNTGSELFMVDENGIYRIFKNNNKMFEPVFVLENFRYEPHTRKLFFNKNAIASSDPRRLQTELSINNDGSYTGIESTGTQIKYSPFNHAL